MPHTASPEKSTVFRIVFLLMALMAGSVLAEPGASMARRDRHVEARLLSDRTHVQPGTTWWIALELKHDPTWHTYWINGGDAGVPTHIEWELPEGLQAGEIRWEVPQIVKMGQLDVYGYEGSCLLLTPLKWDPSIPLPEQFEIKAKVTWMMCAKTCLPGRGVHLTLSLQTAPAFDKAFRTPWAARIGRALSQQPAPAPSKMFSGQYDSERQVFLLRWKEFSGTRELQEVYYFDVTEQITSNQPQTLEQTEHGWQLTLPRAAYASTQPERLKGVLRWKTAGNEPSYDWLTLDVPLKP